MLQLKTVDLKKTKIETLVIPVGEDAQIHENRAIVSIINKAKKLKEFSGKKDDEIILFGPAGIKVERVLLFGLGKAKKIDGETFRNMSGKAVKKCISKNLFQVLIAVPAVKKLNMEMSQILQPLLEGAFLGNHIFNRYKKEKKQKALRAIHFLVEPDTAKGFRKLPAKIEAVCRGTVLTRDWVNTPSNDKRPEQFARSIATAAKKANLKVNVLSENILRQKKFGAMLAVAKGSGSKPCMVALEYKPKTFKKTIVLVGKGVTFDSGGINLKPTGSLETMKMDMAGAATVASALIATAAVKPKVRVIGVLPIVENMLSGDATRPGDIVKSFSGKTVEIGNTDAEGRLILADAMSYAIKQYKPQVLIDMATLTGACVVALGEKLAGVFSADHDLAEMIIQSGEKLHERCWRLPLPEDYKELLKSDFADINNMPNTRWGGAITAALFLSEFVSDTRWAHIDIAGPAYNKKENAYCPAGGTGFGVRLICDVIQKLGK
ncbi:MAG: leucyl aminopeptidase [Thermodesulfobacteriota bacterium]|nr:leucyl aminopeptidase [Thermodesulfobacteriota bacterium]